MIVVEDGLVSSQLNTDYFEPNLLQVVFEDGVQYNVQTLQQVRDKLANN